MISATALDFITWAMSDLGLLDPGEVPEEDEPQDGLDLLNQLVDEWQTEYGTKNFVQRFLGNLVASTASYTIGSGGAFDVAWPESIEFCSVIPDKTVSSPIEIRIGRPISVQAFAGIPQKGATALYPNRVYYDHGFVAGLGTITVYPVPLASNAQLALYLPTGIAQFADLSTQYSFPPGYAKAIRSNLALEMVESFDAVPTPGLERRARTSLYKLKRANINPNEANFDGAGSGGRRGYNIYTD